MPSIKAIGLRMKSVLSTAKITKAMKMVAASKLKGAEKMMLQARPFASSINGLMESKLTPGEGDEPSKNSLLLAISSDKVRHVHCACGVVRGEHLGLCAACTLWPVHVRGMCILPCSLFRATRACAEASTRACPRRSSSLLTARTPTPSRRCAHLG